MESGFFKQGNLKNSTSRLLIKRAVKLNLNGDFTRSEQIFKNVVHNCSTTFDASKEIDKAFKSFVK